jgi:hypothetical protein
MCVHVHIGAFLLDSAVLSVSSFATAVVANTAATGYSCCCLNQMHAQWQLLWRCLLICESSRSAVWIAAVRFLLTISCVSLPRPDAMQLLISGVRFFAPRLPALRPVGTGVRSTLCQTHAGVGLLPAMLPAADNFLSRG